VRPLRPSLSRARHEAIEAYLKPLVADMVTVHVSGPVYEAVRARFTVGFHGHDDGLNLRRLDTELIAYLSPWLHDGAVDIALGGRLHASSVLDFLERRPYVDFVRDLVLEQEVDGDWRRVAEAETSRADAALVSAENHCIQPDTGSDSHRTSAVATTRYLGNSHHRELHDLRHPSLHCQITKITNPHRVPFDSLQEAVDAGYDFCAHCFGREGSRQ